MPIVYQAEQDVQTYSAEGGHQYAPRPEECPHCQEVGAMVKHGTYPRKALDASDAYPLSIQRWRCRACRKSVSSLPSFVLRFRHYLLAVLQAVVVSRYEQGQSWRAVEAHNAKQGAPARRTIERWCTSFAQHAPEWLAQMLGCLAEQDSASPALDPLGEAAQSRNAAQELLSVSVHFLAWAKSRWPELVSVGLNARLSVLWLWGYRQGIARLV